MRVYELYTDTRANAVSTLQNITTCLSAAILEACENGETELVCKYAKAYIPAQAELVKLTKEELDDYRELKAEIIAANNEVSTDECTA